MKFKAYNRGLMLCVKTPWREVQNGLPIDHPGEFLKWVNRVYETENETEIEWLKKHKLFSPEADRPGMFWVFVDPVDIHKAELAKKDEEIARLQAQLTDMAEVVSPGEVVSLRESKVVVPNAPESASQMSEEDVLKKAREIEKRKREASSQRMKERWAKKKAAANETPVGV